MIDRTVLLRKPQLHGNVTRVIRATVLSEDKDMLRVIPEGQRNVISVKASEVTEASKTFATRLAAQHGVVVQQCLPDSPNCLSRICESNGR
jgi:hypothetical protein